MRVLAAMSGGVDSAVAAARAVAAGHDVVGVHLALSRGGGRAPGSPRPAHGCCTPADAADARRAADMLDIPFYVWDFADRFETEVIDDFVAGYAAGQTPNPCVRCNERIKFAALLDRAVALGFDRLVTGHYAQLAHTDRGPVLSRALDASKDQSYVLAVVDRDRLARAMFPLGTAASKAEVRAEATRLGLSVADKPDSHDICFIPDGNTSAWLGARIPVRPGPILDREGVRVGRHDGVVGHTVGQRRGLGLSVPAADGRPRYVLSVSVADNSITVGPADALDVTRVRADRVVWHTPDGRPAAAGTGIAAQIRAHGRAAPGVIAAATETTLVVALDDPLRAVADGQALVIYTVPVGGTENTVPVVGTENTVPVGGMETVLAAGTITGAGTVGQG